MHGMRQPLCTPPVYPPGTRLTSIRRTAARGVSALASAGFTPIIPGSDWPAGLPYGGPRGSGTKAGVAQLVEHNVANVVVVGSNPITRSFPDRDLRWPPFPRSSTSF